MKKATAEVCKLEQEISIIVVCRKCGATLKITPEDVDADLFYLCECTECGTLNRLKRNKLSREFKKRAIIHTDSISEF